MLNGCHTKSSLFNQGKTKFCTLLENQGRLNDIIGLLKYPNNNPKDNTDTGAQFLLVLYGSSVDKETLEEVRYQDFISSSTNSACNVAFLQPTIGMWSDAFRTFHQIQKWYGIQMTETENLTPMIFLQ